MKTSETVYRNYEKTINLRKILKLNNNEDIEEIFSEREGENFKISVSTNEEME